MSIPATTTFGELDPLLKFNTPAGLIPLLNSVVQTTIPTEVTVYIKSVETPAVDQQDLVWIRLTTLGAPAGVYVFHGGYWVRTAPGPGGSFSLFYGDPTDFFDAEGKGLSGPGPVALDYWGWQLMNGHHGTANLSDRFIIGGRMDNVDITGWSDTSGWRTNITGEPLSSGGVAEITLTDGTTFRPPTDTQNVLVYPFEATGQARAPEADPDGVLYGGPGDGSHEAIELPVVEGDEGVPAPDPITIVPPFFAMAYVQFMGYEA